MVAGPRQVGKSTLVQQLVGSLAVPSRYASADEPTLRGPEWIAQQWEVARLDAGTDGAVLVIDEVQKASGWSESVKRLWDEDSRTGIPLKVVLVGAAPLIAEPERWRRYVLDSLVETTVSRDVLLLTRVGKPALLWRLFELGCRYSGQALSYTKMLGQLQDAGNTVTLAHYLDLLAGAGLLVGLPKDAGAVVRQRGSSPKLQAFNTALVSAQLPMGLAEAKAEGEVWGRLVESAVGAHLVNAAAAGHLSLAWWREGSREVDFVLARGA